MSVRWYLLGLVLAALLPVLFFSAAMLMRVGMQERAALERQIAERAARVADEVDAELQHMIAALEVLALAQALAANDLRTFHAQASRVREAQQWENIVLAGPQGEHLLNLRAPYGTKLPPLNRPDVFVEAARSSRAYVSNVVPGLLAGRELTVVTVPVMRDGHAQYVLGAALSAPRWESFLVNRLGPGMEALLVDRDGALISRTSASEGLDVFAVQGRSKMSGWTVRVFMPLAAIEGPVRTSLLQLGGGFLLLLGLSLVLAWRIAQRIARSMAQLTASVRAVGLRGAPLPVSGQIAEVATASRALHDARAALDAADRAKEQFLAVLGHELRNPLAPIKASVYILDQEPGASEPARRAARVIARQAGYLARLVDDLLDVTRIARGKVKLRRELVVLNDVVRRAVEDHAELAQRAGVALRLHLPPEEVRISGDPTRLAQIVGNLLQNAVRFSPPGGAIDVALERREELAEVRVRDQGVGVEAELLAHLFEPFVQGPRDGGTHGGLGLGLPLVKGLAELHGGSARAMSDGPGQGAEFVVTFPCISSRDLP